VYWDITHHPSSILHHFCGIDQMGSIALNEAIRGHLRPGGPWAYFFLTAYSLFFSYSLFLSATPRRVWACGYGGDGALGLGATGNKLTPEIITALDDDNIIQVSQRRKR
jgi:hypothetical protein